MKNNSTSLLAIIVILSVVGIATFLFAPIFNYTKVTYIGIDLLRHNSPVGFTFFALLYLLCTAGAAACFSNSRAVSIIRNILMLSSSLTFMIHILGVLSHYKAGYNFSQFGFGFWVPAAIVVINLIISSQVKPDEQEQELLENSEQAHQETV